MKTAIEFSILKHTEKTEISIKTPYGHRFIEEGEYYACISILSKRDEMYIPIKKIDEVYERLKKSLRLSKEEEDINSYVFESPTIIQFRGHAGMIETCSGCNSKLDEHIRLKYSRKEALLCIECAHSLAKNIKNEVDENKRDILVDML